MIEKILELKKFPEYRYFKFIIVTWNKKLKNILLREENVELIQDNLLNEDINLRNRYNIMKEENEKDWKNREMFVIKKMTSVNYRNHLLDN